MCHISFIILMFIQIDGRKTNWVLFLIGYYWLMIILWELIYWVKPCETVLFVSAILHGTRRQYILNSSLHIIVILDYYTYFKLICHSKIGTWKARFVCSHSCSLFTLYHCSLSLSRRWRTYSQNISWHLPFCSHLRYKQIKTQILYI